MVGVARCVCNQAGTSAGAAFDTGRTIQARCTGAEVVRDDAGGVRLGPNVAPLVLLFDCGIGDSGALGSVVLGAAGRPDSYVLVGGAVVAGAEVAGGVLSDGAGVE